MHLALLPLLLFIALGLAACSTQPQAEQEAAQASLLGATGAIGAGASESYASVTRDGTPFYQFGPAQPSGPDSYLPKGELVKTLRRERGFSHVELDSGQTGYVPNAALVSAPAPEAPVLLQPEDPTFEALPAPQSIEPQPPHPAFRLGTAAEESAPAQPIRFR